MSAEKKEILAHDNLKYASFDPYGGFEHILIENQEGTLWNPSEALLLHWWKSSEKFSVTMREGVTPEAVADLLQKTDYAGMSAHDIEWSWIDDAETSFRVSNMDLDDIDSTVLSADGWLYVAEDDPVVFMLPLDRSLKDLGVPLPPALSDELDATIENRFKALDMALVAKIARNELDLLVETSENEAGLCGLRTSTDVLAKGILEGYLGLGSRIAAPVVERALIAFEAELPEGEGPLSDEFIAGHALAVTARNHAARTFDDGYVTGFAERALDLAPSVLLDHIDGVDDSRMAGIDMFHRFRSAQSCTPQDVCDRAAEYELGDGKTAADILAPADFEEIARGIMASFRGIELEYADLEDIDCRIEEKVAEKSAQVGPSISIPCVERAERADGTDER